MKRFTLEEAEALIPDLERIFDAALELAAKAEAKAEQVRRLEASQGDPAQLAIERGQLLFLAGGINDWLKRIQDLGAVVKGIEPALVDFPSRLGGREVYLCWRLGEKSVTHYHGVEEGFAGRKPLPKRKAS